MQPFELFSQCECERERKTTTLDSTAPDLDKTELRLGRGTASSLLVSVVLAEDVD